MAIFNSKLLVYQRVNLMPSLKSPSQMVGWMALNPTFYLQCKAPRSIAKLVNITPVTMVYGTQITIVTGANLNQLITGGPHIVTTWFPVRCDDPWIKHERKNAATKFRTALIDIVMFECELPLMWMANIIQKARMILCWDDPKPWYPGVLPQQIGFPPNKYG